ncbi:hypothetical protein FA95DRAFT_1554561 [Auriscalpium vulgare]|uniref:Uncharacterized protein n=1 Tax=Auriscalpium vulgare TaxID=40419 RepID=A0ACB8S5M5_9AGAM|nr:hypothetical protein FA95DRAFT_1554561 [Auriscalpium vulgare]
MSSPRTHMSDNFSADALAATASYLRQLSDEPERDASDVQIPFPSAETPPVTQSGSSGSKLTDSDKLSELPVTASPSMRAIRGTPGRGFHRSLDNAGTVSAPDIRPLSSPAMLPISLSDGSFGRETPPKQRVSFDSDRVSQPSPRQTTRQTPASEAVLPNTHGTFSSILIRKQHERTHPRVRARKDSADSRSRSRSHSRAASPLRAILDRWPLHRVHSREELFVAVNPFRFRQNPFSAFFDCGGREVGDIEALDVEIQTPQCSCIPLLNSRWFHSTHIFVLDTFPRQIYLHALARLPSLYFSRVARIFEDAEVSKPDIQRIIDVCASPQIEGGRHPFRLPFPEEWAPPVVSPALARFKHSWEAFVDTLVREWKTMNVVSALLLSAILTIFQIPDAANDPLTRTAALLSLVCALMSLCYGIVYIIRFGTMRSMYRASRFADEAQKTKTSMLWNVWVLLALPSIWLAWSMLAFIVSILSFVWRTGSTDDPSADGPNPRALSPRQALGPRLAITLTLALGLFYFAMVIQTFKSYGDSGPRLPGGMRRSERRRDEGADADAEARGVDSEEEGDRGRVKERGGTVKRTEIMTGLGLTGMDEKAEGSGTGKSVVVEEKAPSSSMSSLGM